MRTACDKKSFEREKGWEPAQHSHFLKQIPRYTRSSVVNRARIYINASRHDCFVTVSPAGDSHAKGTWFEREDVPFLVPTCNYCLKMWEWTFCRYQVILMRFPRNWWWFSLERFYFRDTDATTVKIAKIPGKSHNIFWSSRPLPHESSSQIAQLTYFFKFCLLTFPCKRDRCSAWFKKSTVFCKAIYSFVCARNSKFFW